MTQRPRVSRLPWSLFTRLALLAPAVGGCHASPSPALEVRIHNATGSDLRGFWLGAGSGFGGPGSRAYGSILSGATTPYRSLRATYGAYSNYNFTTVSGQQFVGSTLPNELIGRQELAPGRYTFSVSIAGGQPQLAVRADP